MAFENAKRLLQNKHARLSTTTEGIYDDNLIVLFWENIEAKHVTECINFLNESTQRVINAPSVFYDISFDSDLHHLHAYYREQDQRIYRVLAPNAITTSSITQSATKWRLLSGETYQAGTSNVVLVMYNVNPANIVALETEALSETFTDSIYLLGGTQLTGTWFNIARESDFQSDTGLYDLRWYISRYNTKEYIFHYKRNEEVTVVNFFKHHMTSSDISNFEDQYYFDKDSPGDYYVSTPGDPTNYISKNGDTTQTGSLSSISKPSKITDAQDGRTVNYVQKPDRENGEIDISVELIYETSRSAGTSAPTENSISNPSTAFIQQYGEPERITKYIGSFKAISLPSSQDVSGTVATGGRSKSVKRVVNPEVQGNLYYYDLFEEIYTAPQDDGDAWMFTSSDLIFERERKTVANYISDADGSLGFEPFDVLDGVTATTGPVYSTVEVSTKRTKNIIKHRKYFVRHPLAADLTAAGITGLETASTSPTSVTQFRVVRLSKDLFAVERIVTTLGTKEVDNDNRTVSSHARYKIQGNGTMNIETQTDGLTGGT